MPSMQSSKGFTLIELAILVVLVGIIAGIAIPSFTRVIESNRLTATTNDLVGTFHFARSEAIRRGRTVNVAAREIGGTTDWVNGVVVSAGADVIRVTDPLGNRITVTGSDFGFRGNGLASSGESFEVCSESGDGRVVIISRGGQIRVRGIVAGECT